MKNSIIKSVKYSTFALLIFLSANKIQAQKVAFGVRFMPTFSALSLKTSSGGSVKGDATLGYGYGGFLGYNFNKMVGMQVEVIYSSITQKYKEVDVENKINLKYLNIPLLFSLNSGILKNVNINAVAGPQIGISMGTNITSSGGTVTNPSQAVLSVKKGDLGLAYGFGLDFGLNTTKTIRLGLGYRGVMGLIDISDNSGTIATNSYYILDKTHIKTNAAYVGFSILF